jgi:hypothetical protein
LRHFKNSRKYYDPEDSIKITVFLPEESGGPVHLCFNSSELTNDHWFGVYNPATAADEQ